MVFLSDLFLGTKDKWNKKQEKMGEVVTDAGRTGTSLVYGIKRKGFDRKEDRLEMERNVRTKERLLNLRFNPYVVNYNTGVE